MCLLPWCRVAYPHGHFPLYRAYVPVLDRYLADDLLEDDRLGWELLAEEVGRDWVRAARPWYPVRGRAFANRSVNFNGVVRVTEDLEGELDEMVSRLHKDLRTFLLNRIVDRALVERRHRESSVLRAIEAVRRRGDP